jgi:acyl-CoA thioester hydrolase
MSMPIEKKVFYHDTDAGGVVYYGRYLNFLEEARTISLEERGLDIKDFKSQGYFFAVRTCTLRYRSPARYGDVLVCTADLTKITAAQLFFDQKIFNKDDRRLVLESEITLVCLLASFKPAPIPDHIVQSLNKTTKLQTLQP